MPCCGPEDSFVSPVVKYVLFFFNFLCWLLGGVLIGVGIWAYLEKQKYYNKEIESVYDVIFDLAIIFLVLGAVIFILGYAGCIGALRENIYLLKFYYFAMLLIFLVLLVGAVLAFVFRDKFRQRFTSLLKDNLIITYQDDPDKQSTIDWLQEQLGCCGVNTYRDWNKNQYYNCSSEGKYNPSPLACSVPHSCCKVQDTLMAGVQTYYVEMEFLKWEVTPRWSTPLAVLMQPSVWWRHNCLSLEESPLEYVLCCWLPCFCPISWQGKLGIKCWDGAFKKTEYSGDLAMQKSQNILKLLPVVKISKEECFNVIYPSRTWHLNCYFLWSILMHTCKYSTIHWTYVLTKSYLFNWIYNAKSNLRQSDIFFYFVCVFYFCLVFFLFIVF